MERLKAMKDRLISCVESQINDLSAANAEELSEAVDMIKDLEETIYYCTVVKAMEDKEKNGDREVMYYPVMYYNNDNNGGSRNYSDYDTNERGNNARGNGRGYTEGRYYFPKYNYGYDPMYYGSAYDRGMRDYDMVYPREIRDYREGRSGNSRRMYMESKEKHEGKEKQMMELEMYMKELNQDITEMINDASPEEKQILSQKLNTLADKIK